jgi:hypothetical protein
MWEADQVHDRTIVVNVQALQARCIEKLQLLRATIAKLLPQASARRRPRILGSTTNEAAARCVAAHSPEARPACCEARALVCPKSFQRTGNAITAPQRAQLQLERPGDDRRL